MKANGGATHAHGKALGLAPEVLGEAEVFAEAEAIDAELEGGAVAAEQALEEGFEFEGAGDVLFDFGELAGGKFFPARADGGVVAEAAEEEMISARVKPMLVAKRTSRTRWRASLG